VVEYILNNARNQAFGWLYWRLKLTRA
jgi:hypothetical protein